MDRGWLPPTINLQDPDPACDLDFLSNGGLDHAPELVVSNSFGFGGVNAAIVLKRP
jgi:3-oxoacyl-[acyl-carrier-protein] synthase II